MNPTVKSPILPKATIYVVIPAYKVKKQILKTIRQIGNEVDGIIVVDDACPENSGDWVLQNSKDARVSVLYNPHNMGVGGAVVRGIENALEQKADIIVKVDGDGQHDPSLIPLMLNPIITGEADYTKGNRFVSLDSIKKMPKIRLIGNIVLSLITKVSSGYWNLFDPTNGYIAVHKRILNQLPLHKLSHDFFFESEMLFRIYLLGARVTEIPMKAIYRGEISSLKPHKVLVPFLYKHALCICKRIGLAGYSVLQTSILACRRYSVRGTGLL